MTTDPGRGEPPIGPLGRRLRAAFLAVAVLTVVLVAGAAFVGTGRGLDTATARERALLAGRVAAAAGEGYRAAGGWPGADLGPAVALAAAAGAQLVFLDTAGQPVSRTPGSAPSPAGPGGAGGSGAATRAGAGAGGTVSAAVMDGATAVGTVRVVFAAPASTAARAVAWWWIAVAALAALGLALLAARLVTRRVARPLAAVASTARAFAAGDRDARTGIDGSGEIGDVARALDEMAEEVAASERARRRAAADVAHELRTPLAVLQAGLEEARDGLVAPDAALLGGLHDQSLRLGRIVADLAALSAAEGGALRLRLAVVDLADLARREVGAQQPRLRAADLRVSCDAADAVNVNGDEDRLRQVVGNVLSNAGRYCRAGDRVTVSVRALDCVAVLEVADTGPGIAPADLPHVFDRLWRGHDADRVGGSGIGLAVVHALVTAHRGTVTAHSDGATGTTVRIALPLADR